MQVLSMSKILGWVRIDLSDWCNVTFSIDKCRFSPHYRGVDKQQESTIRRLGIFTLAQGKEVGLSQQDISRLVAAKDLKRVGRGIYLHPLQNWIRM